MLTEAVVMKKILCLSLILFLVSFLLTSCSGLQCAASQDFIDDGDADCIDDTADNCPDIYNPNQGNSDNDSIGDACNCAASSAPTTNDELFEVCPQYFLVINQSELTKSTIYLVKKQQEVTSGDFYVFSRGDCTSIPVSIGLSYDLESAEIIIADEAYTSELLSLKHMLFKISSFQAAYGCSLVSENVDGKIVSKIYCQDQNKTCHAVYEKY